MKSSNKKNKEKIPMEKVTEGYEAFIKGKEIKKNSKKLFEKTLKKATKQRGSK